MNFLCKWRKKPHRWQVLTGLEGFILEFLILKYLMILGVVCGLEAFSNGSVWNYWNKVCLAHEAEEKVSWQLWKTLCWLQRSLISHTSSTWVERSSCSLNELKFEKFRIWQYCIHMPPLPSLKNFQKGHLCGKLWVLKIEICA